MDEQAMLSGEGKATVGLAVVAQEAFGEALRSAGDVGPDKHGLIPQKYVGALQRLRANLDRLGIA